ncbi:hypothetical protein MNEG_12389 [Monoraphidium neglectum]|uniref:Spt6 acidic N-terminal domain-containing protein n=1 Tax=Monoraphidium neglectum TaxID=145388 RepID=A0A0D2LVL8_9CHLO|nr:hypothetical protein MNEG_12389 [Monoraphidium neglectum]KIY95574.1 hypothetical protein MNEG_12389 [Monoraphidium neglectum]|eukprot:XP_013894594.1 hypothetical protein MNEG_12389 [Monoraphidium neglectum]
MAESEDPASEAQEQEKGSEEPASAEGGEAEASAGEDDGGDEEASAEDSSEEDEEGPDEYEQDDFLVGEDEESGGGDDGEGGGAGGAPGGGGKRKKRKRRKSAREYRLDEEDYDLLEDNQVMVRRPAQQNKRLKRRGDEPGRAMGAQQLKESLFGAGGEGPPPRAGLHHISQRVCLATPRAAACMALGYLGARRLLWAAAAASGLGGL